MSRHPQVNVTLASPRNLRLGALVLAFVAINQIDEPLVNPTLVQELLYWSVRISILAAGLWLTDELLAILSPDKWANPAWLKPVILVSAIGLVPFSIAEILIEPYLPVRPEYVDDELWALSPLLAWLSEYATILTILVPAHLLLWLIIDRKGPDSSRDAQEDLPLPSFLERASVGSVEDVLALQAEEHYVRVYTGDGAELVHCRFRDAVESMPEASGLQVHRSWWVSPAAVSNARRGSRRWQLTLLSGDTVPVSDSYVSAVRERGLLKKKQR